jgi:glycosyltransferase involved in cell wall biosynthesis
VDGLKNVLLLIKGLGRGGAEQILVSSARYGDPGRFRYEVAYLLSWKDAFVPSLRRIGVETGCIDGARGVEWIRRLRRLVREHDIDLVHVHSPYVAIGARVGLPGSMPIVYTEHNLWERYHPATYWGNLLTYSRNDHVFAVSNHVRDSVVYPKPVSFLSMPAIETLYHGPDPEDLAAASKARDGVREELGIPKDAPVVGSVANLKPHKGHEHLLRAAVVVRRSLPEARFVLVGQGPLERKLRARARALGVEEAVIFTGYREDALQVMQMFDVFVLASVQEGLAIALIEAMALGKPSVVTRVGGLPEVVHDGEEGFVVPPSDPLALARAIITVLQDRGLSDSFSAAARRRADTFKIQNAVRRIEDVYTELTS